jgi:hypothetical protein
MDGEDVMSRLNLLDSITGEIQKTMRHGLSALSRTKGLATFEKFWSAPPIFVE